MWEPTPTPRLGSTLNEDLTAEGYQPGAPSAQLVLGLLQATDKHLCANHQCTCGHQGMEYRPFINGSSYRAFAVCPECDAAYEF